MGVHTQGESGFFDEDVEVSTQNEVIDHRHEQAIDGAAGEPLYVFSPYLFIYRTACNGKSI